MLKPTRLLVVCLLLTLCNLSLAQGQEMKKGIPPDKTQIITASATGERVRIAAPSAVVQLRLEVYDEAGQKLFDTEQHGGNVLDWHLQGGAGERVADGSYLCVVTTKNLSGRLSQKMGMVTVSDQGVQMRAAAVKELSLRQTQTVGPIEEGDEGLAVIGAADTQPVTVLAHTGEEAQVTRTRGALSFRLGDFFSGADKEQMRLTEEGNLGIGTAKPKAKLDVAGTIRAREGFAFSDGSTLNVNDKGALTLTSSNGTVSPNLSGTGTQNRLAKWTDSSGTLGNSVALDTGTGLQLTAAPSISVDTNLLYLNSTNGTTGMLAGNVPSYGAANGPFFAMRGNNYTSIPNQRGLFTIAAGNVANPQGDDGSVKFNTGDDQLRMVIRPNGRVGIGTDTPVKKLDVAGDINASNDYNIGGLRVLGVSGSTNFTNSNTFVGVGTGASNNPGGDPNYAPSGNNNSFFGNNAGNGNTIGLENTFLGSAAGAANKQGSTNTFVGASAGAANTNASGNTFVGADAGSANTAGGNTFIGKSAGSQNTTGHDNTFVGNFSGFGNMDTDNNTFVGSGIGGISVGSNNTFVGANAGAGNFPGLGNAFFGSSAGSTNRYGFHNTIIGTGADVSTDSLDHATALGAGAVVSSSNTVALGRADGSDTVDVPGKLQIDTMGATGGQALCWNGSMRVALCMASSLRYKTQVHSFLGGLDIVRRLRPISFTWKEDGTRDLGLGAEEVERVEPLLTFRNRKGEIEGVKYNQLSAVLINAVKEQQQQIRELQRQLVSLKSRVGRHHRREDIHRVRST